jgi:branched-chain amino acid transport system substrate-binding protein
MERQIERVFETDVSRREFVKRAGIGLGGLMFSGVIAACGGGGGGGGGETIKMGFVSPRTGPAASFGEPDGYILDLAREALKDPVEIGGKDYTVQIIDKDSQSNPPHSAQVAQELISKDGVDIIVTTSTPETVNPVSDACEAAGVPCIATIVPWEAWYFGRGAKPDKPSPFKFSYCFSFGVAQFASAYTTMWPQVPTNKKVGVMWPNDADGNAIRASLGPMLEKAGYTIVDPGGYQDGTNDFSSQIALFKRENCEIFNTFPIPPDFATFWRQAAQQGYKPKIAQIAKTGLFPSQVNALGALGENLASAAYWTRTYPYKSFLTGKSSEELGAGYEEKTGKQSMQQVGASMSVIDAGIAALKAVDNPKDKEEVANGIKTLKVETPVGDIEWGTGPVDNVVTTPILGGQWVKGTKWPLDFVLCENSTDPNVPVQAKLKPYA